MTRWPRAESPRIGAIYRRSLMPGGIAAPEKLAFCAQTITESVTELRPWGTMMLVRDHDLDGLTYRSTPSPQDIIYQWKLIDPEPEDIRWDLNEGQVLWEDSYWLGSTGELVGRNTRPAKWQSFDGTPAADYRNQFWDWTDPDEVVFGFGGWSTNPMDERESFDNVEMPLRPT